MKPIAKVGLKKEIKSNKEEEVGRKEEYSPALKPNSHTLNSLNQRPRYW